MAEDGLVADFAYSSSINERHHSDLNRPTRDSLDELFDSFGLIPGFEKNHRNVVSSIGLIEILNDELTAVHSQVANAHYSNESGFDSSVEIAFHGADEEL